MAKQLIAESSAVVAGRNSKGRRTRTKIREGKIYRDDDPVVQGREHLFRTVVEDASAEPGEKRSIRKPRKQAEAVTTQPVKTAKAKPVKAAASKPAAADESDESGSE